MRIGVRQVGRVIVEAFPELADDIQGWRGLEHLQVMELYTFAETAVKNGKRKQVLKAVSVADQLVRKGTPKVRNAVAVSFLENVDPKRQTGKYLFKLLTPALIREWHSLDRYMQSLIGKSLVGRSNTT